MDPISHAIIGTAVVGLLAPEAAPVVKWGIIAGAVIPDIDFVVRLLKGHPSYLKVHRGPTHGLPVQVIWAALIAAILMLFDPAATFVPLFAWSFVGCLTHILFDCANDYGTQALWPLSKRWIALDVIPIIDVWLLSIIGIGWIVFWAFPTGRREVFTWVWVALAGYVGLRVWLRSQAKQQVAYHFGELEPCGTTIPCGPRWKEERISMHPCLFSVNAWRYVVQVKDAYLVGITWLYPKRVSEPLRARNDHDKIVLASLKAQLVTVFSDWARRPRIQVDEKEGLYHVTWTDMRYEFDGISPFRAHAWMDKDLKLIDEGLNYGSAEQLPDRATIKRRVLLEMGRYE